MDYVVSDIASSLSKTKEPLEIPDDFGFHYPYVYVRRTADILKASNFVCWPQSGGWENQDSFLVDDVLTYLGIENRIKWENEGQNQADYGDVKPEFF